jgi:lauroyl/myristoyl acyltransferase
MPTPGPIKAFRHRLEYAAASAVARIVPRLSRATCAAWGERLGHAAYRADARGRAVALDNLRFALGDTLDAAARERVARASYGHFARAILDLFWAPRVDDATLAEFAEVEGAEQARALFAENRGSIFINVHYGAFEWGFLAPGFFGWRGLGVAEDFKNPLLAPLFARLRGAGGNRILPQRNSMLHLFKHLKTGGGTGSMADLTLPPSGASAVIRVFGRETCVTQLHGLLHLRTGAPILPIESEHLPGGRCRLRYHPPLAFPPGATAADISQACWDFYEPRIRANPEQWLWAYKHWRYRPADGGGDYPFYANPSSKFEKLRAAARRA